MPRLILHYAAKHNIGDANLRLSNQQYDVIAAFYFMLQLSLIETEGPRLVAFYKGTERAVPLDLAVDHFPYLIEELVNNFNEKLSLRLTINWLNEANSEEMNYLLLTNNSAVRSYSEGYDFNNYPLGKTGAHRFEASNVVTKVMFAGGDSRSSNAEKILEQRIYRSIKQVMQYDLNASLNRLYQNIETKLAQHPHYPEDFKKACEAIATLVSRLQDNEQLTPNESIDLMQRTVRLIDNPEEYKNFLRAAKNYRMISQGELSAYIMLIAGWAAKIMTANCIGNAWIKLANEKLELIAATQELAETSELCLINPH
ncbi:hypothetical protein [Legionella hackeliae]|uniref:Uncharacterized protein n=1 Tax=Legionella hackeliae TaxID=449 RepID=A0A0A8UV83_LEGHA|nr:hypothetical protein [Legionella hackeliae]KTD11503.1 hypothetical protein Lhac_1899 [Legionella hackeliae]CEK10664.1 conserved protein of unknown function [Legionella hackeliae]STX47410.1 Uncharacterised protein [Legionella hackeliae]